VKEELREGDAWVGETGRIPGQDRKGGNERDEGKEIGFINS
jgi:hypothetical protein